MLAIDRDQIETNYNNRRVFVFFLSAFSFLFSYSSLYLPFVLSPLFSPAAPSCRILVDCVGASVCPVGKIWQKGRRSRGHLSQSDGTAEKYMTRENQFQRRLAPTGLAVKAIVLVLRREREKDGRVLSSAKSGGTRRGEPRLYMQFCRACEFPVAADWVLNDVLCGNLRLFGNATGWRKRYYIRQWIRSSILKRMTSRRKYICRS